MDFVNVYKAKFSSDVRAIFIGNIKNPHMGISIPQYIDFATQMHKQIISIAQMHNINVLRKSCFCILLDETKLLPISKKEYEKNLNIFKTNISGEAINFSGFDAGIFGIKFENILIDILDGKSKHIIQPNQFKSKLSKDNQLLKYNERSGEAARAARRSCFASLTNYPDDNPIIHYFNSYFKSNKNSDCVNLSSDSKTDIFYKNKNGSLNEISIKTRNIHHNDIPLSAIKLKLCVSSNKLLDWKEYLKSDPIKTIKMFFNCQYNTKENVKSPYTSNKNDNVKFLLMYLYNIDNPNYNVSGNIHILNMKKMFNLLSCYMDENLVQIQHNQSSLDIMVDYSNF